VDSYQISTTNFLKFDSIHAIWRFWLAVTIKLI
jgi:hypothetical protein